MRVLFLTHRLPYAPNRGDRIRAYHILKALRNRGAEVALFSLVHDADEEGRIADLVGLVEQVVVARVPRVRNLVRSVPALIGSRPLTHTLLDAPDVKQRLGELVSRRPPDVVLAYCSGMARFALEPPLDGLPCVIDMVDVDSEKWKAMGAAARAPLGLVYQREARMLARFEATAAARAVACTVVNERERKALAVLAPGAAIEIASVGVDAAHFRPGGPPPSNGRVVFCGLMSYGPNDEAAQWLGTRVWPHVKARRPDASLWIVGGEPSRTVQRLGETGHDIHVTGRVPDVRGYLWDSDVAVAPLLHGRGIQTKVLESLAAGVPTVITPLVAAGLPKDLREACPAADTAEAFAAAILALLARSPDDRRSIAARSGIDNYAWDRCLAPLADLLCHAVGGPSGSASERSCQ